MSWLTLLLQVVAVFYVLLVRTTLAAAREELLRTRAFVRMIPSRILSREASCHPRALACYMCTPQLGSLLGTDMQPFPPSYISLLPSLPGMPINSPVPWMS